MAQSSRHEAHDHLLAQIQLTERRLKEFSDRLADLGDEVTWPFMERVTEIESTCRSLKTAISEWDEVKIGALSAVSDLGAAVDVMEADLNAAVASIGPLYELAMDQQVRSWRARLDSLRLQGVLGAMEVRDDLEDLSHRLDQARGGVLVELQNALGDSKEIVVDVRKDVEEVLTDVRHGVERAVAALTGS